MATYSNRMGLVKPAGSEPRSNSSIVTNADLTDKFMPCILVNDGVTPPTGDLYDGALVKEKTSGIIWEARKNGGGTFDKVYVRYPWSFKGSTAATSQASGTTYNTWGVTTWNSGKNSSAAAINGSNELVIPIKGIYVIHWRYNFAVHPTGDRGGMLTLNGTDLSPDTEICEKSNSTKLHGIELLHEILFSAGDRITGKYFQNSGGNLSMSTHVRAVMIEPAQ